MLSNTIGDYIWILSSKSKWYPSSFILCPSEVTWRVWDIISHLTKFKAHVKKTPLLLTECQMPGNKQFFNVMRGQVFCKYPTADFINWFHPCERNDRLLIVLKDETTIFFPLYFLAFWLMVNTHHLQQTLKKALKCVSCSKTCVKPKEC